MVATSHSLQGSFFSKKGEEELQAIALWWWWKNDNNRNHTFLGLCSIVSHGWQRRKPIACKYLLCARSIDCEERSTLLLFSEASKLDGEAKYKPQSEINSQ
jgi:hypothetical protein